MAEQTGAAQAPEKPRKKRNASTNTSKPIVALRKSVSMSKVRVTSGAVDGDVDITFEDGSPFAIGEELARELLACLKVFFGGRGTGTPRKK
jgi:hypothetical protein